MRFRIAGKEYEVDVRPGQEGEYIVVVDGQEFTVEFPEGKPTISTEPAAVASEVPVSASTPAAGDVPGMVTSPMAGKILRVAARKGQRVKKGDVLFVLEAMKMENDIYSPSTGTVTEILVAPPRGGRLRPAARAR